MVLYVLSRFLKMEDIETDLGNEYFSKVLRLTLHFIESMHYQWHEHVSLPQANRLLFANAYGNLELLHF